MPRGLDWLGRQLCYKEPPAQQSHHSVFNRRAGQSFWFTFHTSFQDRSDLFCAYQFVRLEGSLCHPFFPSSVELSCSRSTFRDGLEVQRGWFKSSLSSLRMRSSHCEERKAMDWFAGWNISLQLKSRWIFTFLTSHLTSQRSSLSVPCLFWILLL